MTSKSRVAALIGALISISSQLGAQTARGTVTGVVRDESGAVAPGVKVTLTNMDTGISATAESQADGVYVVPQVLPGRYRIAVSNPGFKALTIEGLSVNVATTLTQDLTLEVGVVTESVQVSASTAAIETASGSVGTTVQVNQVLEMPLVDRDVFRLANLVPGAFATRGVSLGGGRINEAAIALDGVNNSRGGLGTQGIGLSPPVDSMQEFKVEVNNMSAEFGRSTGGYVNAVTKGGTNQFHGNFYEFLRNDKLDAIGWGNDRKPSLRRNNFGASIGGPIVKNRSFFFYNYDGLRERRASSRTRDVGMPEWRRGDFSRATRDNRGQPALVPIHDPETGTGTFTAPRATLPFPGNVIPTSRLDPVALKVLAYVPDANRAPNNPANLTGNWQENTVNPVTTDFHIMRVDHSFSDRTTLFGRYILTQPLRNLTGYSQGYGPADPDAFLLDNRDQNFALNATHLFTPAFFLNLTTGFTRIKVGRQGGDCCDTDYGGQLGLSNLPDSRVFPRFNYQGGLVPVTQVGRQGGGRVMRTFTNGDIVANFSWIRGSHTRKFGGNYTRYNGNDRNLSNPSGTYAFTERFTRGIDASGGVLANTGIRMADFVLGRLESLSSEFAPTLGKRIQQFSAYFQEDWRVSPNLTLNLGARYETETPIYEVAGRMSGFDPHAPNPLAGTGDIPSGALGVTLFTTRNGVGKYLTRRDNNNIAPRFGFAYRLPGSGQSVLRGGFGLFYGNPYPYQTAQSMKIGFDSRYSASHPISYRLRDSLPPGVVRPVPVEELLPTFGNRGTRFELTGIDFLAHDRTTPYSFNFNLGVQHQWRGILFELGYLANLTRHATMEDLNLNQVPPELLSRTDIPVRLRRPWTIYGSDQSNITLLRPTLGISNYHGLTFKSERRYANGIGWIAAYTFSRWIDNIPFIGGTEGSFGDADGIQNIYHLAGEKSLSTNSVPHRLVLSPMWDVPVGKGRRWGNRGGWFDAVLGGWQISTIGTLRSGAPFGVTVLNGPRNILGDAAAGRVLRANLVSSQMTVSDKGAPAPTIRGLRWLNPDAFATPAAFTLGNASRTLPGVLGPGLVNFDSMVAKNFRFRERWRLQFRWETFNTFNSPQFSLPQQELGGGSFGIVSEASGRRSMQLALKLYW